MRKNFSRRDVLAGTGAVALGLASTRVVSAAPAASPVTPELIEAAKKEGKVVYYTSVDLPLAEKVAKAFEAKYSGIAVRVERSGAERVFQRIGQEYSSRIYAADVVNSSDAAHFIVWKRDGILAPYVTEDVAKFYPPEHQDADGLYASFRIGLSVIAYNTSLVKAEDAPKSFADLLDPKWAGKMVKAHPRVIRIFPDGPFGDQEDFEVLGRRVALGRGRERHVELAELPVVLRQLALALQHVDAHGRLAILEGGEVLRQRARDRRVARDDALDQAAHGFQA